jgi:hypothetical protein
MLTLPKPAEMAELIAKCYEDEVAKLTLLRDALEQNRLIEAADAADRGIPMLGVMTTRTRDLKDLIVSRWDVLMPKDSMVDEMARVGEALRKQLTESTETSGILIADMGRMNADLAALFAKVPMKEGEFASPAAKSAALEIDGISRDMRKKCHLYVGTVDLVSKKTEPAIARQRKMDGFVTDGATLPELEGFQTAAKASIERVDEATKGLEKKVIGVVLPVSRGALRE